VDILVEALEGVASAHAAGIVHRDLKPSNIFLATRPGGGRVVKVLDFGISKVSAGPDAAIEDDLTGTAMMLGSPRYISPEQAQSSRDVDHRTDLWSLGVVLYELLDGRCPFAGNTMGEVLGKILLYRPPPIHERRPDVPSELAAVIERCLQRDRAQRFDDVAALARALEPFATTRGRAHAVRVAAILGTDAKADSPHDAPTVIAPAIIPGPSASPGEATQTSFEGPPARTGSGTKVAALAIVAGLLAAAGAYVGATRIGATEPGAEPAATGADAAASNVPPPPLTSPAASAPQRAAADASAAPSASISSPSTSAASTAPHPAAPPPTSTPPPRAPTAGLRSPASGAGVLDRSD
jgi:serine/threonine-protein kinase